MKITLDQKNAEHTNAPSVGDVLVITTRKSGGKKIMCAVKSVCLLSGFTEIVLQKSTNSYFIWEMYKKGESWVGSVWNLGQIKLSTASNSLDKFIDM